MIEDLLTEISERGWYIYSLRDCGDSRQSPWECSLRHRSCLITYGQGSTAELDISSALDAIERATPHKIPVPQSFAELCKDKFSVVEYLRKKRNQPDFIRRV